MTNEREDGLIALEIYIGVLLRELREKHGLDADDKKELNKIMKEAFRNFPRHEKGHPEMAKLALSFVVQRLEKKRKERMTQDEFTDLAPLVLKLMTCRYIKRLDWEIQTKEEFERNLSREPWAGISPEGVWGDIMNLEGRRTFRMPGSAYSSQ